MSLSGRPSLARVLAVDMVDVRLLGSCELLLTLDL
jgi:hypothetical protein